MSKKIVKVVTANGVMSKWREMNVAMLRQIGYTVEIVDLSKEDALPDDNVVMWIDEDHHKDF